MQLGRLGSDDAACAVAAALQVGERHVLHRAVALDRARDALRSGLGVRVLVDLL